MDLTFQIITAIPSSSPPSPEQFLSDVEEESAGRGRTSSVGGIPEVMEVILGQLPISQLYCSCRLVCRKWNAIIQREKVNMPAGEIVQFSIDFTKSILPV